MKLLYLHGTPYNAQVANNIQVFNMCQAFSQVGVELTLAIPDSGENKTDPVTYIADQLGAPPGFKIITFKKFTIAGRLQILGNYWGARSIFKKIDADLCFVRDPLLLSVAIQAGLPVVFEVHHSRFHNSSKILNKIWEREVLEISQQKQMVKFLVISEALKKVWLAKGVPQEKLLVAHDGFNHNHFINSKSKEVARDTVGLPVDKKIVVYAGSLYEDRGVERIIALAKVFTDILFVVLGGDENQKYYYQNLAHKENISNTLWVGYLPQTEVPAYFYAADVLIFLYTWALPHIKMLSPLKLFEYMAAGRIIVGEAFPTITEVLEHGKTAFLAEPADFASLCENLFQALNNDRAATMAEKARQQAFSKYTWENRAKDILSSIEGLLG